MRKVILLVVLALLVAAPAYGQFFYTLPVRTVEQGWSYSCNWDTTFSADSVVMTPVTDASVPFTTTQVTFSVLGDTAQIRGFTPRWDDDNAISKGMILYPGESVTRNWHDIDSVSVSAPSYMLGHSAGNINIRIFMDGYRTVFTRDLPLVRGDYVE